MAVACHPYRSNKEAKYPHLPCCLNNQVTHIRGMFSWRIKVLGGQRSMYGLHVVAFCWAHQIHLLHFGVSWWELEALTQYTWFLYSNSGKYSYFPTQTRLQFSTVTCLCKWSLGKVFLPTKLAPKTRTEKLWSPQSSLAGASSLPEQSTSRTWWWMILIHLKVYVKLGSITYLKNVLLQ
jgi:hypothetical protein